MFPGKSQPTTPVQNPTPSTDPFEDFLKKYGTEEQNSVYTAPTVVKPERPQRDYFEEGPLKNAAKPSQPVSVTDEYRQFMGQSPDTVTNQQLRFDFVRQASDNTNRTGEYIDADGKRKKLEGSEFDTFEGRQFGYGDHEYLAAVKKDEKGNWVNDDTWNPLKGITRKFDDEQNYKWLYPSFDENGQPVLRAFYGTKFDRDRYQVAALNTFGPSEIEKGFWNSLASGLTNTVLATDDLAAGFVKFGTQPARWFSKMVFLAQGDTPEEAELYANGSSMAQDIDKWYKDTREDTQQNEYTPSQQSDQRWSADWFGSGIGSVAGSLAQFGGIGKGIKLSVAAANLGAKKLGFELIKRETANTLASYGSSAIIGFGAGYNEAKSNGLSDNEAFAFALPVGMINTLLEAKLGSTVDKYLIGNADNIAKELFNETAGKALDEAATQTAINKVVEKLSGQITKDTLKDIGENVGEEVLQEATGQLFRYAFNAFLDGPRGEGRFKESGFDGGALFEAGFFSLSSAPLSYMGAKAQSRNYGYEPDKVIDEYSSQGKSDQLIAGLDQLLSKGIITEEQYAEKVQRIEDFDSINETIKSKKINFGRFSPVLKSEYVQLSLDAKNLQRQKMDILEQNAAKLEDGTHDINSLKEDLKKALAEKNKQSENLHTQLSLFESQEFVAMRNEALSRLQKASAIRNPFRLNKYVPNVNKLLTQFLSKKNTPVSTQLQQEALLPEELKVVLEAVKSGNEEAIQMLQDSSLQDSPILQSPVLSEEDKQLLAQNGIVSTVDKKKEESKSNQIKSLQTQNNTINQIQNINEQNTDASQSTTNEVPQQAEPILSPAEMLRAKLLAELVDLSNLDRLRKAVADNQITPQIASELDQTDLALSLLTTEQKNLFHKLRLTSGNPNSILFVPSSKTGGRYMRSLYTSFIEADVNKVLTAKSRIDQGRATQADMDLQSRFFHLLMHESTHAAFDFELTRIHKQALQGDYSAQQSWQRMTALATTAYQTLRARKENASLYFFSPQVAGKYFSQSGDEKLQASLEFVHEFFAEALGNRSFIQLLNSIRLDTKNPELRATIDQNYPYSDFPPRTTLWQEIIKAVQVVFSKVGDILNFADRSLLSETYAVASQYFNPPPQIHLEDFAELETTPIREITNSDAWSYQMFKLFGASEGIKFDELFSEIISRVTVFNLPREQQSVFERKFEKNIAKAVNRFTMIDGTFKPVFFRTTNTYLITYQEDNGTPTPNTKRVFMDSYGNLVSINTNIENKTIPVDFSKPAVYDPFLSENLSSPYFAEKREILNAFDRAHREGFSGKSWLRYSPDHEYIIGKGTPYERMVRGQVSVVYQFKDGTEAEIGYTHDLSKIKLSRLLASGASIDVEIRQKYDSIGSKLSVRRNENGEITDIKYKDFYGVGYRIEEGVFPSVEVFYKDSDVSKDILESSISADPFTHYDETLEVPTEKSTIDQIEEKRGFREIYDSFAYDDVQIIDDAIRARLEVNQKLIFRRARHRRSWASLEENELHAYMENMAYGIFENLKSQYVPMYGDQVAEKIDFFGLGQEGFYAWLNETHQKVLDETARANQMQDGQDWEGEGFNPLNTISPLIRYDVERLMYIDPSSGARRVMDFIDASDILYESFSFATSIEDALEKINEFATSEKYDLKTRNVAASLHLNFKNYLENENLPEAERLVFKKAIPSYLSQLGSYRKHEAIVFQPNTDNSVRGFYPSQSRESKKTKEKIISKIEDYIEKIKAHQRKKGTGKASTEQWLATNKIFGITRQDTQGDTKDRFSAPNVFRLLNRYLNEDTLITGVSSPAMFKGLSEKEKGWLSTYINPETGMFYDEVDSNGYEKLVNSLISYMHNVGLDDFPFELLKREKVADNEAYTKSELKKKKTELDNINARKWQTAIDEGKSDIELDTLKKELIADKNKKFQRFRRELRDRTPLYRYHTITFHRYQAGDGDGKGTTVEKTATMLEFAVQLARFTYTSIEKIADGESQQSVSNRIGELEEMAQLVLSTRQGSQTPSFYFDAGMAKRWSRKIRSYRDDLMVKLAKNIDGLLSTYSKTPIYEHNNILKAIARNNSEPIDAYFAGVKSQDGQSGTTYTEMDDADYMYSNLAGFVTLSDRYWHFDKTPSDKPGINLYKLFKISPEAYLEEIEKIKQMEEERNNLAGFRFSEAFEVVYEKDAEDKFVKDSKGKRILSHYQVRDQAKVDKLVERADYKSKNGKYIKGDLHDRTKYFYGGLDSKSILSILEKEADEFYKKLKQENVRIPVSSSFEQEHNVYLTAERAMRDGIEFELSAKAKDTYAALLEKEKEKIVRQWYINATLNQFHLEFLLQGDPLYYKNTVDVSKRMAGVYGPMQHHLEKGSFKLASLRDIEADFYLPKLTLENGVVSIGQPRRIAATNRGDAQGYVTETFARKLTDAYGSLSGFGQVFKPLLFGVQPQHIESARPSYLKLSLFVVPDPFLPKNQQFYTEQPAMLQMATKMYNYDGTDQVEIALFESGIKVGMSDVSSYQDSKWKTQDMDLSMLGFQNNPKHITDEHSDISGMSQGKKIFANLSPDKALIAQEIEAKILQENANKLLLELTEEGVSQIAYESLSAQNHTKAIAEVIKDGIGVDNPVFGVMVENLLQARFGKTVEYLRLPGNKLVNVSEIGIERPEVTEEKKALYEKIGRFVGDRELKWAGPRQVDDLTEEQFYEFQRNLAKGKMIEGADGYIHVRNHEDVYAPFIYPAEVLVPKSMGEVGERLLAARIPTSGAQSIIPAVIVGHLPDELTSGNTIVSPAAGPGILGFDFDVDGLFAWKRSGTAAMKRMFDTYFGILTEAKNYPDIVEPVDVERFDDLLFDAEKSPDYNKAKLLGRESFDFHEHSVAKQIELRNLNRIGKTMIGIAAVASNVHNVLSASRKMGRPVWVEPVNNKYVNFSRAYSIPFVYTDESIIGAKDGEYREYVTHYLDMETGEKMPIAPIMVTMINLATDNAKLQKLFKLGITLENAGIFFDMVLKGIDPKYALYLLNQPIVKEYEKATLAQRRVSDAYKGNDPYRDLVRKYEARTSQVTGNEYVFEAPIFKDPKNVHDYPMAYDTLKSLLSDYTDNKKKMDDPAFIKQQLHVLEKYKYASQLSQTTTQIASLVRLDSSYPSTFIEAANRFIQIQKVIGKTNLSDTVLANNPIYKMHYDSLAGLLEKYSELKLIAHPTVFEDFFDAASGLSIDNQKKLEDGLKNYLVQSLSEYNKSVLSDRMTNYHFVDWSSRIIGELMNAPEYYTNAFLRLLSVETSLSPDHDTIINQQIRPSMIRTNIVGKDFSADQVKAIQEAFLTLPTAYEHAEFDKPIDIQKMLIANLLYSKGLGMGGFSFSQFLPKQIVKELDDTIKTVHKDMNQSNSAYKKQINSFFGQITSQYSFLQREIKNDELSELRKFATPKNPYTINITEGIRLGNPIISSLFNSVAGYRSVWVQAKNGERILYTGHSEGQGKFKTYTIERVATPTQYFISEFSSVEGDVKPETTLFSVTDILKQKAATEPENATTQSFIPFVPLFEGEQSPDTTPDILSYYQDVVGMKEREEPMDMLQLSEHVVNYRFGELATQIWGPNPTINPLDVYDPSYLNFNVRPPRPYTYLEIVDEIMGQYRAEEGELLQLKERIDTQNLLGVDASGNYVLSTDSLAALHEHLAQNISAADGLAKTEFAGVFRKVANELATRRTLDHVTAMQINPAVLDNQKDVNRFSSFTTSIAEMSAQQAALQAASKLIDTARYRSDAETNKTVGRLKILLSVVYKAHFVSQSDIWHRKFQFWNNHRRQNEPYLWLYERDANGEFTGRFIPETINGQRNPEFVQMDFLALQNTPEGRLAKAKLELYHFLRLQGDALLQDNQYTNIPHDRAFMPHLAVDMEEAYAHEGIVGAYLVASGLLDYSEVLDKVQITHNGRADALGNFRRQLLDKKGTISDQKKKADLFKKLLEEARQKVKNRQSNLSPYEIEQLESFESSFQTHAKIPFRAVMRKRNFSINTSRILTQHFTQLIFKKYHDPVLSELQATKMYYAAKSQNPADFENVQQFIELYGNRYFFGKKDTFSNATAGRILETLSSVTVSSFLGLNGTGALLNAIGGLTDVFKNNIENYGWAEGTVKFGIGMKRLMGDVKNRTFEGASDLIPRLLYNPKALALAERFNIENFSQIDTEQEGSPTARFSKFLLQLQRSSEIAGRVASFLGELSQGQWDNYVLNPDGTITITNPAIAPTIEDVNRWKYQISTKQGFYDPSQRYNYNYYGLAKAVMLFKNWMLSFMKERLYFSASNPELNYASIDRYGKLRQGYWVTGALLAKDYLQQVITLRKLSLQRPLSDLENRNLRKLVFDVLILASVGALGNLGDDEEEDYWTRFANKLNAQLFFQFDIKQWIQTVKQPTPSLAVVENAFSALSNLFALKADKAMKNTLSITPGGEVVEWALKQSEEE